MAKFFYLLMDKHKKTTRSYEKATKKMTDTQAQKKY